MLRIQRWIAGLEILLGLGVAVLAALVVSAAASLRMSAQGRPDTTPIPPRAIHTSPVPETAAVLAALGRAAPTDGDAASPSLRVWGVAEHGDERLAVVADASGTQHLLRPGDAIDGATIAEVTWEGVTLVADGRRMHVPLERRPPDAGDAPAAPSAPVEAPTREIRQVSADSFLVDRAFLLGEAGNMSALLAQLRAVPEVEAGAPIGFRVFAISDDSVFRRLGLRNGDVVRRVNGTTLHDPAALLSFLQGMGDESRIALDLVRAGRPSTLVYDLR